MIKGLRPEIVKIDLIDPPLIVMHKDPSYLKDDIEKFGGVFHPVILNESPEGRYRCIAGFARIKVMKMLGFDQVPALIGKFTDEEAVQISLIENKARRPPDPIAEAMAIKFLEERGKKPREIADDLRTSLKYIHYRRDLLRAPECVKKDVEGGEYGICHVHSIMMVPPQIRMKFSEEIKKEKLTVIEAEKRAKLYTLKGEEEYYELQRRHEIIKRMLPYSASLELNWRDYRGKSVPWKGMVEDNTIKISVNTLEEAEEVLRHEHIEYNLDAIRRPVIDHYNAIIRDLLSTLKSYVELHVKVTYPYLSDEEKKEYVSRLVNIEEMRIEEREKLIAERSYKDTDRLARWLANALRDLKLI